VDLVGDPRPNYARLLARLLFIRVAIAIRAVRFGSERRIEHADSNQRRRGDLQNCEHSPFRARLAVGFATAIGVIGLRFE